MVQHSIDVFNKEMWSQKRAANAKLPAYCGANEMQLMKTVMIKMNSLITRTTTSGKDRHSLVF